jgi:ABC-type nitrate/sulfonate/bicarbonate transport system permease component
MTRSDRSVGALIGIIPIALIIGVWQAIAASGLAPPSLLPAPAAVFARLVQQLGSPAYLDHVATTLFRLFAGFAIAVVIGVTIGLAATGSRAVEGVVRPLVRVLAPVPKIALYPAFILTLGFENASKIALVVADAAFPILLATHQGTSAVEMIISTDGLGHLLVRASRSFQTIDMFVPLITISLLGLLLNVGFNALRARLLIGFPEER